MWAKTKTGDVTCPFCRSKWETDSGLVPKVVTDGGVSSEGYINVADQLGINPHRGMQPHMLFDPYHLHYITAR